MHIFMHCSIFKSVFLLKKTYCYFNFVSILVLHDK